MSLSTTICLMQAYSETCFAYLRRRIIVGLPNTNNSWLVIVVKKNMPPNAGDTRDAGSIPESGRSPGGGNDNPLQCSFLENPMDRGAWQVIEHRVAKSQT